jgi:hypothetical protein
MNRLKGLVSFAVLIFTTIFGANLAYGQITPSADAYTNTAGSKTNYGASALLDVDGATQAAYIQFNLASIPATYTSVDIGRATLKLYVNSVPAAGSFNVDYVNGSWTESTINSSLAPVLGTTIAASVPITTADKNQFILIDVTERVIHFDRRSHGVKRAADKDVAGYGAPAERQIEWARHPHMMQKIKGAKARQLAAAQKQAGAAPQPLAAQPRLAAAK